MPNQKTKIQKNQMENEYENFLRQLENKKILKRHMAKDENGNIYEKWDLKPGLIIIQ